MSRSQQVVKKPTKVSSVYILWITTTPLAPPRGRQTSKVRDNIKFHPRAVSGWLLNIWRVVGSVQLGKQKRGHPRSGSALVRYAAFTPSTLIGGGPSGASVGMVYLDGVTLCILYPVWHPPPQIRGLIFPRLAIASGVVIV